MRVCFQQQCYFCVFFRYLACRCLLQVLALMNSDNYLHRMTVLSAIGALAGSVHKDVVHNSMLPAVVACSKVWDCQGGPLRPLLRALHCIATPLVPALAGPRAQREVQCRQDPAAAGDAVRPPRHQPDNSPLSGGA